MRRERAPALRLVGNNGIAAKSSWGFTCGLSGGQPLQVGRGRGALVLPIRLVLPWIVGDGRIATLYATRLTENRPVGCFPKSRMSSTSRMKKGTKMPRLHPSPVEILPTQKARSVKRAFCISRLLGKHFTCGAHFTCPRGKFHCAPAPRRRAISLLPFSGGRGIMVCVLTSIDTKEEALYAPQ